MFPTIMNQPQWEQRKKNAPTSFSSTPKASTVVCEMYINCVTKLQRLKPNTLYKLTFHNMYILYVQNSVSALLVPSPPLHLFLSQFCQLSVLTGSLSVARVDVIVSSCQFSKWQFSMKFVIIILYVLVVSLLYPHSQLINLYFIILTVLCGA